LEAGGDEEDAGLFAVGPVGEASVLLASDVRAAVAFVEAVQPEGFAGLGIDGDGVATGAGGDVEDTVYP